MQAVQALTVHFHSTELFLVDHDGQPFVPMKPVVKGMGLDWKSQHVKLTSSRFKTCVVEITIQLPSDTQTRAVTCLPLRKLTGWLMSIHPNKVKPELRGGIIAYQNECDDALWAYWNEGMAIRTSTVSATSVLSTTIGTDGFHMLGAVVKGKVSKLPAAIQRRATAKIWSQTHAAFGVRSAADIPADQLDSARNFIAAYALEGEWLGKEPKYQPNLSYPIATLVARRAGMLTIRNNEQAWLDVTLHDLRDIRGDETPCEKLLGELHKAGYDIEGCRWELRTYRNKVRELASFAVGINRVIEDPHRYAIKPNGERA